MGTFYEKDLICRWIDVKTSRIVERTGRATGKEGGTEVWLEPGVRVAWPKCGGAGDSGHGLRCKSPFSEALEWFQLQQYLVLPSVNEDFLKMRREFILFVTILMSTAE
mmetsp:Transcript_29760/g.61875  ORF Transcript_29760/g.61875 Transcript_29760/m.61875 type:complete len:108 (+) Transcript_29760:1837-2160(+)